MSRRVRSMILVLAILAFPDTLWRWLAGNTPSLAALWDKEGGDMDPNGRVIPSPATTDEGGDMDPDG